MKINKKVKKTFGFGCMRLPMLDEKHVDMEQFKKMIDLFMENGYNYFDTAHMYVNELSEPSIKEALVERYDRESFTLTNKLSGMYFNSEEDILPLFNKQLEICGVEYFDFYLMHGLNRKSYIKYKECHAFEFALKEKAKGRIKHIGMSFHDSPETLDMILTEHPEIEIVQIQFNYLDYLNKNVESKAQYEVVRKHHKPIIVMEPVRGGALSKLPKEAEEIIDLKNYSASSYALRFASSFEGIEMVLSGMSNLNQMEDNLKTYNNFQVMEDSEKKKLEEVVKLIFKIKEIPCTGCRYCTVKCPKHINIPEIFKCLNDKRIYNSWGTNSRYGEITKDDNGKASDCIKCGKCEDECPQHLKIRDLLVEAKLTFEKE